MSTHSAADQCVTTGTYHNIRMLLIGGVSYDYQRQVANTSFAPINDAAVFRRQISPKAALVWAPSADVVLSAGYSRSLGGVDLDQSVRLEPTQLAGFVQSYRSLIPISLVGGIGGAQMETTELRAEKKVGNTYLAISAQRLFSGVDHRVGVFAGDTTDLFAIQATERVKFEEKSLQFSVRQLLGDYFTAGITYRFSDACLRTTLPDYDQTPFATPPVQYRGLMHFLQLEVGLVLPCGVFAKTDAKCWSQMLLEDLSANPAQDAWQVNLQIGYRAKRRRWELALGILNLFDQDYRLHPVNIHADYPRNRTIFSHLIINF